MSKKQLNEWDKDFTGFLVKGQRKRKPRTVQSSEDEQLRYMLDALDAIRRAQVRRERETIQAAYTAVDQDVRQVMSI